MSVSDESALPEIDSSLEAAALLLTAVEAATLEDTA